jgi:enoyl-CoA hydratase
MSGLLRLERSGKVGIVELARPEKFNCLSGVLFADLTAALKAFEADEGVRVLLIRAQGKNFCTGADLPEVDAIRADRGAAYRFLKAGHDALLALEQSRLPVVCAVQGLALAGGLELVLACDVVFAGRSARLGDQHAQFGLFPGWGGSQRLPRLVGMRRALDLFFSARWLDAETAERWGLVNYVVEDANLGADALAYCAKLADRSGYAITKMKRLARDGAEQPLYGALHHEIDELVALLDTPDLAEGLDAFRQRRTPKFR